ncbi:MAG: c-type cytochrome [Rhodoferax sp.]|nr:c-type cytochrome [Rhodoferax sp.]
MKQLLLPLVVLSLLAVPALADEALAKKKNCLACHAIAKKVVGPAYKDVAAKYAGQNVVAKLSTKIMKGGSGAWGAIPMPANPQVNQAEAETLVKWVLSLK